MRGKIEPHKLDLLACISSLERIVKGSDSYTTTRQTALLFLAEIIHGSGFSTNDKEASKLLPLSLKLKQYCSVCRDIKKCCSTTVLYHHLHLLPSILHHVYSSSTTGKPRSPPHKTEHGLSYSRCTVLT